MALLSIRDLAVEFRTHDGTVHAVNGVSFDLDEGETLGLVGESGCGKSVTSLAVVRLLPKPAGHIAAGSIVFDGENLVKLSESEMRDLRGREIAMIFQDPMTSLNPVLTVGEQLTETIQAHAPVPAREARARAAELLSMVGIPDAERHLKDFPHQFSGGMRQRVMIAIALALQPKLLIADEPTTALDVTIQAQVLELLQRLPHERGTATILITHDLGVVAGMADRINVMYAGYVVESAVTARLFERPYHPYTVGLLHSIPRLDAAVGEPLLPIEGAPPDLRHKPVGCPFANRCAWRLDVCWREMPPLDPVVTGVHESVMTGPLATHRTACWNQPTEAEAEAGTPLRPGFVPAPPPGDVAPLQPAETPAEETGVVMFGSDAGPLTEAPGAHGLPEPPEPGTAGTDGIEHVNSVETERRPEERD